MIIAMKILIFAFLTAVVTLEVAFAVWDYRRSKK